jgi:ornithine carbamoyltransferase
VFRKRTLSAVKDLLHTSDLSAADMSVLLDLAAHARATPEAFTDRLRRRTVVMYFAKPSTRTRLSFETAIVRLGGTPITVTPHDLQLDRGETIEDTARATSAYADAFVIRTFSDANVARFAAAATIPVINALTDAHHPCQSVADMLTLRDRFGDLRGLRIAYVGDGYNNVTHSLIEACALMGCELRVATPPGFEPDPGVVARAMLVANMHGARVSVTSDAVAAVTGARVVYADVWASMGKPSEESDFRRQALEPYRVDDELLQHAHPDAVFLHCLPAHRGEEVTAGVLDGPRSLVWEQAKNRLHTGMAILVALLDGRLEGAAP